MCDSNLAVCRTGIVLGVESAAVHLLYFPSFLCSSRWDFVRMTAEPAGSVEWAASVVDGFVILNNWELYCIK